MNVVKAVCQGKKDEHIHRQFVRYGKGEYERFLFTIKKGKNLSIKSSFDFSTEWVGLIAQHLDEEIDVKGKIITNYDFSNEIDTVTFSKRGKLYTGEISEIYKPEDLKKLYDQFRDHWLLLKMQSNRFKLKAKNSLPKPGGTIKPDFCSATVPLDLLDEFAFDFEKNFTVATIVHKIIIDDVIVPKEYLNDFAKARLMGVRKGKLIREIDLDGKKIVKEYPLEV